MNVVHMVICKAGAVNVGKRNVSVNRRGVACL